MFSKLLKHEWKANGNLLSFLSLGALGAGLLAAFVLKGLLYIQQKNELEGTYALGTMGLSSALTFLIIALVAYLFAVQFITLFRFYKHKFTDEGYLTFTLPVNASQLFLSSLVYILFWLVVSCVVLSVAVAMIILIGASRPLQEFSWEIRVLLENLRNLFQDSYASDPLYRVLRILTNLVTPVYSVILLMTSIVIGCILAKKRKILATIGSYYVINFAIGILESILEIAPLIALGATDNLGMYMNVSLSIYLLLRIGLAIGGYILSTRLMTNKLNLP